MPNYNYLHRKQPTVPTEDAKQNSSLNDVTPKENSNNILTLSVAEKTKPPSLPNLHNIKNKFFEMIEPKQISFSQKH